MYVPLLADIITAERWLIIMSKAVLSNFLIYCVINALTPGPGNILALNIVTNYGYKKGKTLFFGIFAGYYVVQILCAIFVYGVNSLLPNVMEVMKYIGAAYILWLAIHIAFSKPSTENAEQSASFLKGFMLQFVNVKIYMFGVTALPGQSPGRKAQRSASRTAGTTVPEIQLRPPDGLPWAQPVGQRCDHAESGWENLGALCGQHRLQGTAGVSG